MLSNRSFVVGIGVGDREHALLCQKHNVDFLVLYNFFAYRRNGETCGILAGYLPYGDANQQILDIGGTILPALEAPVVAGICGNDPFRVSEVYIHQLKQAGFTGIQNFPSVGLIDGAFIQNLEETGMGYGAEVLFLRKAKDAGLATIACVSNKEQVSKMVRTGADMLLLHFGMQYLMETNGNGAGVGALIKNCAALVRDAKKLRGDIKVLFPVDWKMPVSLISDIAAGYGEFDGLIDMNAIGQMKDEEEIKDRIEFYRDLETSRKNEGE